MNNKGALIVIRIGHVSPEIEVAWNHWYDTTHIPNRINKPDFLSARRFVVIGGESQAECKYLSLYDLNSVEAMTSESYLKLRDWEGSLPPDSFEAITPKLPNFFRGIYEQIYPEKGDYKIPNAEIVLAIGHDVPSNRDQEFNAWYDTEHIHAMMRVPGFITARRFKLLETQLPPKVWSTTGGPPSSPKYMTLYDLEGEKVFQSEAYLRERDSPWTSWVRSWYSRPFRIIGRRISIHFHSS